MPTRESVLAALADRDRLIKGWLPGDAELAGAPLLDNWWIDENGPVARLCGWVTGHPDLSDDFATTSGVVVMSELGGWARTANRWYRLGTKMPLKVVPE
jgi:hypothetical protein